MKLVCMSCWHEFEGTITKDELGWHSVCPECESSFDVDVPQGRIVMAFANDETDDYFTDDWYDDNELLTYYAFNTPEEFMATWRKMHDYDNGGWPDSMWYWVLDDGICICSGACDPDDEEIFVEHWGNIN